MLRQGIRNGFQNAGRICENVVVPEAQNAVPLLSKESIPHGVTRVRSVLPAIDLDNEASLPADEIDDIGADRLLANKLKSAKGSRTKVTPEFQFRIS